MNAVLPGAQEIRDLMRVWKLTWTVHRPQPVDETHDFLSSYVQPLLSRRTIHELPNKLTTRFLKRPISIIREFIPTSRRQLGITLEICAKAAELLLIHQHDDRVPVKWHGRLANHMKILTEMHQQTITRCCSHDIAMLVSNSCVNYWELCMWNSPKQIRQPIETSKQHWESAATQTTQST